MLVFHDVYILQLVILRSVGPVSLFGGSLWVNSGCRFYIPNRVLGVLEMAQWLKVLAGSCS